MKDHDVKSVVGECACIYSDTDIAHRIIKPLDRPIYLLNALLPLMEKEAPLSFNVVH